MSTKQMQNRVWLSLAIASSIPLVTPLSTTAQIIPDNSLGAESTQVSPLQPINGTPSYLIDNGAIRGSNLFQSLQGFSVPSGEGAYFANPAGIETILMRVTGNTASNVDGTIGVLGNADLFVLNPAGLQFGPNARLDLSGSFLGTTATDFEFADGTVFGTSPAVMASPLLGIDVPLGLQFGQSPAAIDFQGMGHRRASSTPTQIGPLVTYAPYGGLAVNPNQTLALVGGDLNFSGAVLQAPGGRIELGSVAQSGPVELQANGQGWAIAYPALQNFGKINLGQSSIVEVGGLSQGNIQLQGGQIEIKEGSQIVGENFGPQATGDISVQASESLSITGTLPQLQLPTSIRQDNFSSGEGGTIRVQTPQLQVEDGASLFSLNFGSGSGSDVMINSDQMSVTGYDPISPEQFARVGTLATASGQGGNLQVTTHTLDVLDGGLLGTINALNGSGGGNVNVQADHIQVQGFSPGPLFSTIGANNIAYAGGSGDLEITTQTLVLRENGLVATSSISAGDAGRLEVNASQSIEIDGSLRDSTLLGVNANSFGTAISSSITPPTAALQALFGLPEIPSGAGGDLLINTPTLLLRNAGLASVTNLGIGSAGQLRINANEIILGNNAELSAFSLSGNGGNVDITAQQLLLFDGSDILAAAFALSNTGNGGNIKIDADLIAGFENSNIIASASLGRGGNIGISTQAIIGLKFSPQFTPGSDINASSRFGVSGNVQVDSIVDPPNSEVPDLDVTLVDPDQLIGLGCELQDEQQLTVSGKGGLLAGPTHSLQSLTTWSDDRFSDAPLQAHAPQDAHQLNAASPQAILPIEATGWTSLTNGQTQLQTQYIAQQREPSKLSCRPDTVERSPLATTFK